MSETTNDDPIYDIRCAVARALVILDVEGVDHKQLTDMVVDCLPDFFRQPLQQAGQPAER